MPRTARKIEELADEGEHMTDALAAVLAVAEEQGTVTWSDVSDDMTSGEWGRLIEKGLLVDAGGDGFVVDDPEGIRDALEDADPSSTDSDGVSFTQYDKMAVGGVLMLFLGYSIGSIRQLIGETLNILFGPLNSIMPFYVIVMILAILTGLWSAILQDKLGNTEVMGEYQEKNKELKERRKKAKERGDDEELERIREEQMEMMGDNLGMFKAQFRPMIWIMLFTIPVFLWLYYQILDVGVTASEPAIVLPLAGEIPTWTTTVLGPIQTWLAWYFVCSLGFGQLLRKSLNVQTSPT
jgi:uncharacterized membrane protein (DUF106 family)